MKMWLKSYESRSLFHPIPWSSSNEFIYLTKFKAITKWNDDQIIDHPYIESIHWAVNWVMERAHHISWWLYIYISAHPLSPPTHPSHDRPPTPHRESEPHKDIPAGVDELGLLTWSTFTALAPHVRSAIPMIHTATFTQRDRAPFWDFGGHLAGAYIDTVAV